MSHRDNSLHPWITNDEFAKRETDSKLMARDRAELEARIESGRTSLPMRKHVSDKTCSGKESVCMPGKNGVCVACVDDN